MHEVNAIKEYKECSIGTGHLKIREQSPPLERNWHSRQGICDGFGNMGNVLIGGNRHPGNSEQENNVLRCSIYLVNRKTAERAEGWRWSDRKDEVAVILLAAMK